MFREITEDNLKEIVDSNKKVLVQFSAGWCGNCRMIKPKFKRMADEFEGVEFVLVDAEKFPNSRSLAQVDNLPTFAAFNDGALFKQVQTNKADNLKELANEIASH